jgi:hypothetical protein
VEASAEAPSIAHTVGTPDPGKPLLLHWRSLSDGLLVAFVIVAPSLFAGLVLRDQRVKSWSALLLITAVGLLIGGAIAGRHRRAGKGAITQGVAVGLLTTGLTLVASIIRTLVLNKGVTGKTVGLWLGVEVGAIIVAAIGGLIGRRLYLRSRQKKSLLN